jgi:hypothetical protein
LQQINANINEVKEMAHDLKRQYYVSEVTIWKQSEEKATVGYSAKEYWKMNDGWTTERMRCNLPESVHNEYTIVKAIPLESLTGAKLCFGIQDYGSNGYEDARWTESLDRSEYRFSPNRVVIGSTLDEICQDIKKKLSVDREREKSYFEQRGELLLEDPRLATIRIKD